ncbi:MAG: septation protein A [Pseudomonadota bacterium]
MKFIADFFPVLLFFVAYQLYDIYVATAAAIAASVLQVAWLLLRRRPVSTMQWATLGLLAVFGGMTLLLRDPTFVMWKPTVVNWLFGAVFLGAPLFMKRTPIEHLMGHAVSMETAYWRRLNAAWGLFFMILGALNLYVAYSFEEAVWVNFKLFGLMGLTLLFAMAQAFFLVKVMTPVQARED